MNQLIIIDSKDREMGKIYDFTYTFTGYPPAENTIKYRINKVTIPYAFNQTIAQSFRIKFGTIATQLDYDIVLPAGNYSPTTLVAALNKASDLAIGVNEILWSYDSSTNIFKVETVNVFNSLQLNFNINDLPPNQFYKSVGKQMGFFQDTYTLKFPANEDSSTFFPNLTSTKNIYIRSQALATSVTSFFNKKRDWIVQSVLIGVNPEQYITFENQSPIYFPLQGNLSTLDFQLLDDHGELILLELDWCIEVQYYYDEKIKFSKYRN